MRMNGEICMTRLCASLALFSLFGLVSQAEAVSGGVPKLNVEQSCREAQAFGGGDNKLAYKGCMQDENDAFSQLQKNWSRYKPENRSNCLAQGISPMPSYVEILTCIEMYDSAGLLNKPIATSPQLNGAAPALAPASANPSAPSPGSGVPDASAPAGGK
jgi:hypothetical protein